MTYRRVIPRDLFNEGNLLTCLGRLWIKLDERRDHKAALLFDDDNDGQPAGFDVYQDPHEGSISSATVALTVRGDVVPLFRPLNARDKWPLWARFGDPEEDYEDVRVFDLDGELSPEFWAVISGGEP